MSIISIRLNETEENLFKNYSKYTGKNLSELFKTSLKEYIEDRIDYEIAVKASEEFEKDPRTFTVEEIMEELL